MTVTETIQRWLDQFPVEDGVAAQKRWASYFTRLVRMTRKKLKKRPRSRAELAGLLCWCRAIAIKRFPQLPDADHLWTLATALTARRVYVLAWRKKLRKQGMDIDTPVRFEPEKMDRLLGVKPAPGLATQLAREIDRLLEGLPDTVARSVAQWKLEGLSDPAIALKLELMPSEVATHLRSIRERWRELDAATAVRPSTGPASGWRLVLRVIAGPHRGRKFTFRTHDTFLVGRSQHAHFRIPKEDKHFSRIHFMVEVNPPSCRLVDMKSRNGTYVNDTRVLTADLHDGDRIKAGHTILRVALRDGGKTRDTAGETTVPYAGPIWKPAAGAAAAPAAAPLATPAKPAKAATPPAAPPKPQVPLASPVRKAAGPRPCPVCSANSSAPGAICADCRKLAQAIPQVVPGYTFVRELGGGSLGKVFLAHRHEADTRLAVKLIRPAVAGTRVQIEKLLDEGKKLRGLEHPRIAGCRDLGDANGQLYFASDYVHGRDGEQVLEKNGPLPLGKALHFTCQILETLAFAHGKGFVHRNLKPTNVIFAKAGGQDTVTITDFGLARVYQDSGMSGLTLVGDKSGNLVYLAPERITSYREAHPPVDQYAAAAILYRLLTGELLFDLPRTLPEQLLKIMHDKPVPVHKRRPDVPRPLAQVIHKALAKSPQQRFENVAAFRAALLPFAQ